MANLDKLGLGLDDIIRNDRSSNRRGGGGRGGKPGFRGRGTGRNNGFQNRGGGGLVNIMINMIVKSIFAQFSREHSMHQLAVGSTIYTMIIPIELKVAEGNEQVA